MKRQGDDPPMPSLVAIVAPPRRPKSAGAFPSANRKLISAGASTETSHRVRMPIPREHSIQQRRPQSSRFPASGTASPRPRPCSAALQLWRQPGTPIASSHNAIVQRVVREEIIEQRHVTLDAQRQLHELQATIARRQEELELAHRHLQAFDIPSAPLTKTTTGLAPLDEGTAKPPKAHPSPSDVASTLKEEIAHQDAYKKRLRYMHERLLQQVRYLEANADLLAERRRAARRERSLCQSRVKLESDKNRQIRQQLREVHGKQAAFKRNALPVLESYRDELASRLVITQRRHDADRRRDELIRFVDSRSTAASKVSTRSLTSATAAISRHRAPSGRLQRRDSYDILVADADENKRETLFAVYEGQYARVLRETGEVDLSVVLERFQSYRESTARLREIESELRTEGARLASEQQTHSAMVARLRVSGPTDVAERRQRLRDRLEGALHTQQLEKNQARDRVNAQLKAFVYVQQGVLHIVELLQCLQEDRGGLALTPPRPVLAVARTVMGGNQPAEVALKTVAPALQTLVQLAREVGRRGLQREWFKLPPLGYSVPQVARLEQFAPEGQVQRGPFDFDAEDEDASSEAKDSKHTSERPEEEVDEERRDAAIMRRSIKRQEKDTLRQAETILRQTNDARKLLQMQQQQDQQRMPQSPKIKVHQQSDVEIVAAHFREQRRAERQEHRFMNGSVLCAGNRRAVNSNNAVVPAAAQSPRRRQPCEHI